jgi:hypothetical protein
VGTIRWLNRRHRWRWAFALQTQSENPVRRSCSMNSLLGDRQLTATDWGVPYRQFAVGQSTVHFSHAFTDATNKCEARPE